MENYGESNTKFQKRTSKVLQNYCISIYKMFKKTTVKYLRDKGKFRNITGKPPEKYHERTKKVLGTYWKVPEKQQECNRKYG